MIYFTGEVSGSSPGWPLRLITCRFCGDMVQAGRSAMDVRDRLRGLSERSVMLKDMDIHRIVVHQSG